MKPRTNNLTGLIDNLNETNSFGSYQPEKGTIYFTGRDHQGFYNKIAGETGTGAEAREKLALFYILSSIKKFREHPGRFLFLSDLKPNPQAFKETLSREEQALVQLAFYLYSDNKIFQIKILDLFNNLGEEYSIIAIDAIKLRFNLRIH